MGDEERTLGMDIDVTNWPGSLRVLYRDRVGVNPHYALAAISDAFDAAAAEAEEFEGEPPDDWVPRALLNLPEKYIVGFVYIAERRKDATLKWNDLLENTSYEELVEAVFKCFMEMVPEDEQEQGAAPLVESPPMTPSTPASTTASSSRSSSIGRSRSAASSRTTTSKPRSPRRKPTSRP